MKLPEGVRRLLRIGPAEKRVREEVDDEIDFHFAQAVRKHVSAGLTHEEALERARAQFGDDRAYRRKLENMARREARMRERREWIDAFAGSLRYVARRIRRNPGYSSAMVVILALGIGANAVMFGVVDRLLLSPPQHVVEPDEVSHLYVRREIFNGEIRHSRSMTYPDYLDLTEVPGFSSVAAYTQAMPTTVGRGDDARQAEVATATANLFPLLGVQPAVGRFFGPDETRPEATPTAVLAEEYWEREFGRDPTIVGRTMDIGQGRYDVVGIAPAGFTGAELAPVDIWLPLGLAQTIESGDGWFDSRGWYFAHAVARLAPGSSVETAEAQATAAHRAGRSEMIEEGRYDAEAVVIVAPVIAARGPTPTDEAQVSRWLAGVSLIVLLIACFNVANLLLTRAIHARREVAVRLALGVGKGTLFFEQVAEGLALAMLGAFASLLLAAAVNGPVHEALLPGVAFADTALQARLMAFTLVVTVGAGVLAAIIPALQVGRSDVADDLRAGGRGSSTRRSPTRSLLLVGQAALSVVLLVGAGLFVQSLRSANQLDLGYDARQVAVIALEWNETLPAADRQAVYVDVQERVRALPGVHASGLTYTIPFYSSISLGQPRVPGLDSIPRHHNGGPYVNKVGSGYFEAMGLSILQGRGFEALDDRSDAPPVAIVSQSMANAIWPAGDAIGACMLFGDDDDACTEVVGVVENHNRQDLVEADPHFLYFVNQAHPDFQGPPQALMVGTVGEASRSIGLLRSETASVSPLIRFANIRPLRENVEPQLRSWRLGASMFSAFGLLALIVAAWGLYSVLAFDVALRQHELGVRAALGASVGRIVRLVLHRGVVLIVTGIALGLVAALGAARLVQPLLFEVSATDPYVYGVVAAVLILVGFVAGSLPAWRATRIDPREAFQAD